MLGKISIINKTPLFHPRISAVGSKACYIVNGELDRVLLDIINNILMRPDVVRPRTLYKGADAGYRPNIMEWYIKYGPYKVHEYLMKCWEDYYNKNKNKKNKIQILDSSKNSRKKVQIIE